MLSPPYLAFISSMETLNQWFLTHYNVLFTAVRLFYVFINFIAFINNVFSYEDIVDNNDK